MSKKFEKLLDAATDSTLLEPNWDSIISCYDAVRSGEIMGKQAMSYIRKKMQHENPHVVIYALLVLDACVKNTGPKIIKEVATREFMEEFKNLGIDSKYDDVRNKVLEMLQCWAMAFANKPECKIIVDTHNLMKLAGFDFPSIKEADAMFMAQVAPDWQEGAECFRCRVEFAVLTRKHHCRACGQIFCGTCSSKVMPLPQFGIEKEVRVCDSCFEKGGRRVEKVAAVANPGNKETKVMLSEVTEAEKEKLRREKEEEDLALAIALSKKDAESKESHKGLYSMYTETQVNSSAPPVNDSSSVASYQISEIGYKGAASNVPESPGDSLAGDDPLAKYLNRDYWQQRKTGSLSKVEEWAGNAASAPVPSEQSYPSGPGTIVDESISIASVTNQMSTMEVDGQTESTLRWCQDLKENVSVMENRIRSNTARGRPVVNDTAIQGLFLKLTELHAQVLSRMSKLDEDRAYYERLQDHLAHIVDARSAVNELRDENERKRQERVAEEQRLRQAQMKQTLDMMRMKKHAMLMEQRDIALQRFQQQEQEMVVRRQQPVGYYQYSQQQGYPPNGYDQQQYYNYAQQQQYRQAVPVTSASQYEQYAPQNTYYHSDATAASMSQNHVPGMQQVPLNGNVQHQQQPLQQQQPPQQHHHQQQQQQQQQQPSNHTIANYSPQSMPVSYYGPQSGQYVQQQCQPTTQQSTNPVQQDHTPQNAQPYAPASTVQSYAAPAPDVQQPVAETLLISFD